MFQAQTQLKMDYSIYLLYILHIYMFLRISLGTHQFGVCVCVWLGEK